MEDKTKNTEKNRSKKYIDGRERNHVILFFLSMYYDFKMNKHSNESKIKNIMKTKENY